MKIKKERKILILLMFLFLLIIFFAYLNRSAIRSVFYKITGRDTVQTIIDRYGQDVKRRLENELRNSGFGESFPQEVVILAFKEEKKLQVYGKNQNGFILIKEYPFTASSGVLGPKLKEGDKQIPEGIYKVEYLNPNSLYHLSIKVSYPNQFDISKSNLGSVSEMGGDIFIHGDSVTVGCIPIGDSAIEEVFVLTQNAFSNGVKIIISPRDFRVNDEYPSIDFIDWENELYSKIEKELNNFPIN